MGTLHLLLSVVTTNFVQDYTCQLLMTALERFKCVVISNVNILAVFFLVLGQYPAVAVAGSPTGVPPSSQHQMPITSQPQPEMYMSGVQMNGGGMGAAEYQTGSNVGANVQSQVSEGH